VTFDLVVRGGLLLGSTTEGFADIGACGEQIAAIRLDLDGPLRESLRTPTVCRAGL
jgi:hypothetical protein